MSYVIAFMGTKDGQGLTTVALAVASQIARTHNTLFVDADMSGTGTAVDSMHLNPHRQGMNLLLGEGPITSQMLQRETIPTRSPRLGLVPGLLAICGSDVVTLVDRLLKGGALSDLPVDFVVFDLGAALAHPWLHSSKAAAQAVARLANRVFVVFQDSPARMARTLQVLKAAQPPKAELLLVETRRGSLNKQAREAIQYNLPDLTLAATVKWDARSAMDAEDRGIPMPGIGEPLLRTLQIVERATVVLAPGRPSAVGD